MPTMPRLVAALLLAIVGFIVSEQIKQVMPEGTGFGWFSYVNLGVGILCGWFILGSRAGRGFVASINNGFTAVAALVFWGLFIQGSNTMVEDSLKRRFSDPLEAVAAIFQNIFDYGLIMLDSRVVIPLLVSAILVGPITEAASRAWK